MTDPDTPSPPAWLAAYGPGSLPELSDRDAACLLLPDLDYDAQLAAIHHILRRHRDADEALRQEIADIEATAQRTSGWRSERVVIEWTDRVHASVYQDAAHSMAAVGMLAPLVESIFNQAFQGIRRQFYSDAEPPTKHVRWQRPAEDRWDCHFVWSNGRRSANLVEGILQLADAVGVMPHLPEELRPTLQALFEYRNKMFHCGFEWPLDDRQRFTKRISDAGWPADWFATATSRGAPWVFYFTDTFIQRCIKTIEDVILAIGAFAKRRLNTNGTTGEVVA